MPNKPNKCRYRLLKLVYPPEMVVQECGVVEAYQPPTLFYLERSVRFLGMHLWWTLAFPYFFEDHERALRELQGLCGRADFEFRVNWIKENCV